MGNETFNTGDIGNGSDGSTLNGNIALFNSSHNATGAVTFNSLDMNVTVNATLNADTYTGTLKIFVIATA